MTRASAAMDDRDTIRRRIIDRAVGLYKNKNPSGGMVFFTTAHYGQAVDAEFKMPSQTLDNVTCTKHLLKMGDLVERAGGKLWRDHGKLWRRKAPVC